MKIILFITTLFITVFCSGQDVSTPPVMDSNLVSISSDIGTTYWDSASSVTKWSDGKFEIKGDTLSAIKLLWKRLDESEKREFELDDFVGRAVDFTNNVPDYWKNSKTNKAWKKYYAELRKQGFKITTK